MAKMGKGMNKMGTSKMPKFGKGSKTLKKVAKCCPPLSRLKG